MENAINDKESNIMHFMFFPLKQQNSNVDAKTNNLSN